MKRALVYFLPLLLLVGLAGAAMEELSFATRLRCDVNTPSGSSLDRLTFQQGTTPLIDVQVLRGGRPISTDTTVTARLVFGASATAAVYSVSTNYAVTNNSYLVQVSTVGTNSAAATNGLWWYTIYFDRSGKTFWTGNGELVIEKTTSTADGTVWQAITTSGEVAAHNTNTAAHADIRALATNASDSVARAAIIVETNRAKVAEAGLTARINELAPVASNGATAAYYATNWIATNTVNDTATNALAIGQELQSQTNTYLLKSGGVMSGVISMGGNTITNATGMYYRNDTSDGPGFTINSVGVEVYGMLGLMNATMNGYGNVISNAVFRGDGAGLTGITAVQVGAVGTNDARYLAALTNASAFQAAFTNGTTGWFDGTLNGSNGVFFTKLGTNYWLLTP